MLFRSAAPCRVPGLRGLATPLPLVPRPLMPFRVIACDSTVGTGTGHEPSSARGEGGLVSRFPLCALAPLVRVPGGSRLAGRPRTLRKGPDSPACRAYGERVAQSAREDSNLTLPPNPGGMPGVRWGGALPEGFRAEWGGSATFGCRVDDPPAHVQGAGDRDGEPSGEPTPLPGSHPRGPPDTQPAHGTKG